MTWSHQPGNITGDSALLIILTHHWVSCPVRMAVTCYYHCDLKQMSSSSIPSSCSSCYHNHRPLPLLSISVYSTYTASTFCLDLFVRRPAGWPHLEQSRRWRWSGSLLVCNALMSCECNHAMCCCAITTNHTMMPLRFVAATIYMPPGKSTAWRGGLIRWRRSCTPTSSSGVASISCIWRAGGLYVHVYSSMSGSG